MTYNPITYTASGGQTVFNIPFTRISDTYIRVATKLVGATDYINKSVSTDYTIVGNTVVFNTGLASGVKVRIWRSTNRASLVDFNGVKNLTTSNLGLTTTQQANIAEEVESDLDEVNAVIDGIVTSIVGFDPDNVSNSYLELQGDVNAAVTAYDAKTADVNTLLQKGVSPWVSSRAYVAGDVAGYSNNVWIALASNTNSAPTDVNANWVRIATRTGTIYALPTNHHDVRINYTDANTITVLAGSRVRSSDDTTDIVFSADRTCVLNASGSNGLDTGTEASNTWYNLYAIYNPSTLTSALLFSTVNEAVSGSITLPSGFTKKRQLKFAVRNNASSNIIPFFYQSNFLVRFDGVTLGVGGSTEVLNSGVATAFTDISLSNFVPPISRISILHGHRVQGSLGAGTDFRRKGDTTNGFTALPTAPLVNDSKVIKFDLATDNAQTIQYRNNVSGTTSLSVLGFYVTEVL